MLICVEIFPAGLLSAGGDTEIHCADLPEAREVFVFLPREDTLRIQTVQVTVQIIPEEEVDPTTDGDATGKHTSTPVGKYTPLWVSNPQYG